jgi:hypothetical protein
MRTINARAKRRTRTAALGLTAALACAGTVAAAPAAAAAAASTPAGHHYRASHTVDIVGVDFGYRIHTHGAVRAGLVRVRFHNRGDEDHQAQLFRLNDGVTPAKFRADLASGNLGLIFVDSVPAGGAAIVRPWDGQQTPDPLQGGTYAVVCFVMGPDGVPHFAKGMVGFFTVHGTVPAAKLARLRPHREVAGVVTAHDFTYTIPRVLHRDALYEFVDTDSQDVHEINLGRLKPGKTVADAKAYFQRLGRPGGPGPAPFWSEGGHGAVVPHGGHGWFRVDDDRGRYVAFCLVPDDKTGIPHAALGMVVGVRVR